MDRLRRLLPVVLAVVAMTSAPCRPSHADAPRIVSLAPHITELLFAAGAGQLVVGASEYSDYPSAALDLPRIGDAFRLDYERIVALRPDLAVAWQSGTPIGMIEQLRALGLRVVELRVERLDDIADAIAEIGRIAGTGPQAGEVGRQLRGELDRLRAAYAGRAPVRVFVELDHRPLFTVTGRHLISEMVELCGGVNVFGSLPGLAPMVDLEAVIAARPEAILYTGPEADPRAWWRDWPEIPAVASGTVLRVPADLVSRATPRVTAGVRAVCEAIDTARPQPGGGAGLRAGDPPRAGRQSARGVLAPP